MISNDRLLSILNNTKLQKEDNTLYQFLKNLVESLGSVGSDLSSLGDSITNINNTINNLTSANTVVTPDSGDSGQDPPFIIGPKGDKGDTGTLDLVLQPEEPEQAILIPGTKGDTGLAGISGSTIYPQDGEDGAIGPPGLPGISGISSTFVGLITYSEDPDDTKDAIFGPSSVSGFGITNQIVKWRTPNILGNSIISEVTGSQIVVSGDFQVTATAQFLTTVDVTGDFRVNTSKFTVTASNGNIVSAGSATAVSFIVNTLVGTFGNQLSYDGVNQMFIGVPGTASTAKKVQFIDSAGNGLVSIDSVGNIGVAGTSSLTGNVTQNAEQIYTPAQAASLTFDGATNNNNVSSGTKTHIRVTANAAPTGACFITGFDGGTDGRLIVVSDADGANNLLLKVEDAASTAANRIAGVTNRTVEAGNCIVLIYDGTSSRWRFSRAN